MASVNLFSNMPKRIILVRHGESEVNDDETVLEYVPNHKVKLSNMGRQHARTTGAKIRGIVSDNGLSEDWKAFFYVSPSNRTWETVEGIVETFPKDRVAGVREECRLREQHFGNFQELESRRKIKRTRNRYGKFFYCVPDGESSANVYDRVSAYLEGLWRDMKSAKDDSSCGELNLIVVSHGLTILLFLMKWFNWTVNQFDGLTNPKNCEYRVLQLGPDGDYSLAVHHKPEELKEWGLTEDMIKDQMLRASGQELLKCVDFPATSDDSGSVDSNNEN